MMKQTIRFLFLSLTMAMISRQSSGALDPSDTWQPTDTQKEGTPPSPQEALASIKVPEGFKVTLFAAEPDIRQPIDMKFDDRGRLWVCEGYAYGEWKKKGEDRIVILWDKDGDGQADTRSLFPLRFSHLSSVEIGFGGVWVLDSPHLLFIPDADADLVPDGPAEVLLDGWTEKAEHNQVSGLMWGPDGWLYGRHGITQPSLVGKPGTPDIVRTFVEPGVWRFHPVTREFEIVLRGMTNPWGMDWDAVGELYLSGNVNGHLWHGIPGALYERMFGTGSVPNDYERLKMIGERPHYESTGSWQNDWSNAQRGRQSANDLGGGHSHCGLLIYQGTQWPETYRNQLYMANTHGRRINQETTLLQEGKGSPLGRHVGDLLTVGTPWFRGVSLLQGPDGSMLFSDWCDYGECHDHDGVHRNSGRIYRLTYGQGRPQEVNQSIDQKSSANLAKLAIGQEEWFVRHARRLLHERAVAKQDVNEAAAFLQQMLESQTSVRTKLRALWALYVMDQLSPESLLKQATSTEPSLRSWAIRLMCDDRAPTEEQQALIVKLASSESSPIVLLHLCSLLSRVPPGIRWPLAEALCQRKEIAADPVAELVLWHCLEPHIADNPDKAAALISSFASTKLKRFIPRRLAASIADQDCREALNSIFAQSLSLKDSTTIEAILQGTAEALQGRTQVPIPTEWPNVSRTHFAKWPSLIASLGIAFSDETTLSQLRQRLSQSSASDIEKREALAALVQAGSPDAPQLVVTSLNDPILRSQALLHLGTLPAAEAIKVITPLWKDLPFTEKTSAIQAMLSRTATARAVLEAVGRQDLAPSDISPSQAQQIAALQDSVANSLLQKHWGTVNQTAANKESELARYKALLTKAGDASKGHSHFTARCSTCHKLFGEGGALGPDLTGSGRKQADYILQNVLDPNAAIPRDYLTTLVTLKDGQVLAGLVPREDETTLTLQTITEKRVLEKSKIVKTEMQSYSFMPQGLLTGLSDDDFRDLMAYLASDGLPKALPPPAKDEKH